MYFAAIGGPILIAFQTPLSGGLLHPLEACVRKLAVACGPEGNNGIKSVKKLRHLK